MAAKIGVLAPDANPAIDQPYRHVKRSAAHSLIRKLLARRISEYLIQELIVRAAEGDPTRFLAEHLRYQFTGRVPETETRIDWAEPILPRYPAVDQTSFDYGAS